MHLVTRSIMAVPVLLLLLAGCGGGLSGGHSAGHVAVIDLDKIAAATGRDKLIGQRVLKFTGEQEKTLNKLRDDSRAQVDKQLKQLPDNASAEAKQKVAASRRKLEQELGQQISKARQGAGQLRSKLIVDFRGEVEPVARRVAVERGMNIVMIKQNAMLYIDPQADISDAVIDEMQKSGKQPAPASEPAVKPDK